VQLDDMVAVINIALEGRRVPHVLKSSKLSRQDSNFYSIRAFTLSTKSAVAYDNYRNCEDRKSKRKIALFVVGGLAIEHIVPPRERPFPQIFEPMMASLIKDPFDSPDRIFETKLDGYRAIVVIDPTGKARLWSRNHLPLEPKFPTLGDALNKLKLRSTILDEEIVALDKGGIPRFQLLQQDTR
jgi:ATP-dependent DNA ligase